MNKAKLDQYRETLESFISDYQTYTNSFSYGRYHHSDLSMKMQRQLILVSNIVSFVHGGCSLQLGNKTTINFRQALTYDLSGNLAQTADAEREFIESNVESTLNEAIGNIINRTIPTQEIEPIIPIKDEALRKRCLDLLNAPGSFDRVINQATQVLEDRLRSRLPFEKLCEIIPEAKNQIGENLANRLLAPPNPAIIVSDKPEERSAFHKIVIGVIAYLRHPSHHTLNDDTEWSLAWSVVGIVDSLLSEIDNSYTAGEEPKPKRTKKNE